MSIQYREGKNIIPVKYATNSSGHRLECQGLCSCSALIRSNYDQIQQTGEQSSIPKISLEQNIGGWKLS
jgi:hypothetical protein